MLGLEPLVPLFVGPLWGLLVALLIIVLFLAVIRLVLGVAWRLVVVAALILGILWLVGVFRSGPPPF